jgi:hypothetical protein
MTPQCEIDLRFYTTSAVSRRSCSRIADGVANVWNRNVSQTAVDRGCVKTRRRAAPRNIDPSERAVFDYFRVRKGERTPENEMDVRFHTASTRCSLSCRGEADVGESATPCNTRPTTSPAGAEC